MKPSVTSLRLVIHDFVGHAFPMQLSRELASRGHSVLHLNCAGFQSPKGPLSPLPNDPPSLTIKLVELSSTYPKYSYIKRYFVDKQYTRRCATIMDAFQPRVILSGLGSPSVQEDFFRYSKKRGIPFVNWVQDCYGIAAEKILAKRLGLPGKWIGQYIHSREQMLADQSDATIFISEDFRTVFKSGSNVRVIENWAPLDELPMHPKVNPWSTASGLAEKTVFLYSGTLGLKHNPDLLVQLAQTMKGKSNVVVAVVSQGLGRQYLEERKAALGLTNLLLFDFQPFSQLPDVIGSGDVLIALIEDNAGAYSVPSKVLTYLCAGRALLLSVPSTNLAARIVTGSGAGVVVEPSDQVAFLRNAETLASDENYRQVLAAKARAYALSTFDIKTIGDRFEELLSHV